MALDNGTGIDNLKRVAVTIGVLAENGVFVGEGVNDGLVINVTDEVDDDDKVFSVEGVNVLVESSPCSQPEINEPIIKKLIITTRCFAIDLQCII